MPPLDLTDAEHLKRVVVEPVVAALRAEMRESLRPIVDELSAIQRRDIVRERRFETLERRIGAVERFKARIAAVCAGVAVVAGVAWRLISDRVGNFFLKGH
jgi:hypothetical protein